MFLKFPIPFSVPTMSSIFGFVPAMVLPIYIAVQQNQIQPPQSISDQMWLVSVVVAAMGIVKMIMWVRGDKEDSKPARDKHVDSTIEKLNANDQLLTEIMQRLTDNQLKALENHGKILEALAIFKLMLENQEKNTRANLEQIAAESINSIKDFIRRE